MATLIECNNNACKFNEDGWCPLDRIDIDFNTMTPMGFVPICQTYEESSMKENKK